MSNSEIPELTDTQITLMMKAALDNNASIVQSAAFIYGQQMKQSERQRTHKMFVKQWQNYVKQVQQILGIEDVDQ